MAIDARDILQLNIKGVEDQPYYRCFGYILPNDNNTFYLVHLDPDHEVYE